MQNPCPTGAGCVYTDQNQQNTTCLATCTDQSQCRTGYVCIQQGFCLPGTVGGGGTSPIGGACTGDPDCADTGSQCVTSLPDGYCTIFGCDMSPCPSGSTCFQIDAQGGTACLADCASRSQCRAPEYACHAPGACLAACDANSCDPGEVCGPDGLCIEQSCTMTGCPTGMRCDANSGACVTDVGVPPPGPVPSCNVPSWRCTGTAAQCAQLVPFMPEQGPGYWNYPLNGETTANQYRSYIRRDVMMLVKYAAAMVDCLTPGWTIGNGLPLGLGDMSESNGAIPGTSIGRPGHPMNTHEDGQDMDIAYYQLSGPNNHLRAICDHYDANGNDASHCTSPPNNLDIWRTALFVGYLHASSGLRVIGVDGQAGPALDSAIAQLCSGGWLNTSACMRNQMTYEVTNTNRGWFHFHHHHLHVSINSSGTAVQTPPEQACLQEYCASVPYHSEHMSLMPTIEGFDAHPLTRSY